MMFVLRSGRDDDREACADLGSDVIKNRLTGALLHAEKLVELVDLSPDVFLGFQGHDDELAMLGCVEHLAKILRS